MYKIMKRVQSLRGFTLIEMMLAIAIILMMTTLIFSTFYIVNSSHARVAVINDAKDYAALNMDSINRLVVNSEQIKLTDPVPTDYTKLYYDDSVLKYGTGEIAFEQYKLADGRPKWRIKSTYKGVGLMLSVRLDVYDNSTSNLSDVAAHPYYTLTRSIYLPNNNEEIVGTGSDLYYKIPVF